MPAKNLSFLIHSFVLIKKINLTFYKKKIKYAIYKYDVINLTTKV